MTTLDKPADPHLPLRDIVTAASGTHGGWDTRLGTRFPASPQPGE